jgi:hypothetical protein
MTEVEISEEIVVIAEAAVDITVAVVAQADKAVAVQADRAEEDKFCRNKKKSFNRNKTGLIEAITSNFKPQISN